MKIIVYTITDCEFSKQEREYLTSHTLQYEEKNLETNKEFLTEMLAVSNNFAGTPVTKIEKDDGTIVVLKGFTKEEFDKELGFTVTETPPVINPLNSVLDTLEKKSEPVAQTTPTTDTTVTPEVATPVVETPTITEPTLTPPADTESITSPVQTPVNPPASPVPPITPPTIPDFKTN